MHELSIAEALVERVIAHTPRGGVVRRVRVRVGPMRGIEPESMQWGWKAATLGTECEGAELDLDLLPWQLTCPQCHRQWTSPELYVSCQCGCDTPGPDGGDELDLMSMDVEVEDKAGIPKPE